MLDEKAVIETAIHELLHTAAFADCHDGKWRQYASLINESTRYIIRRTGNDRLGVNTKEIGRGIIEAICPRCRKIFQCYKRHDTYGDTVRCLCTDCSKILYKTLPESPLMNIDDTARKAFVDDLTDKELLSSFVALAPYTDEKTTTEIFFRALDGIEDFSQFKIVEPLKKIGDFVSKNTKKKILNELYIRLIDGGYDNKIHDYNGYVVFTGFFALTRFYEPSCHYLRKYDHYISH